jgi:GNAT superfamily N-acetyltransferase
MSNCTVRAARAADEAAILAMAKDEMDAHERLDPRFRLRADAMGRYALYLRDRLREIDSAVFVAEADGRVVGVAIGSIRVQDAFFETRRYGYVSDLMVLPELRRRGIGRALWDRVALWFKSVGLGVVRLHVATRSPEARAFWRRVGAEDFLAEAWIDLPSAEELVAARRVGEPAAPARTREPDRARLGGERLAGDSEVL